VSPVPKYFCHDDDPAAAAQRPQRPNFLLIVADDLNFDSVGFMGGVAPNVTPNIDRLAAERQVFTRTYAAVSVWQPSRQAMLSGKYPPNYGSVGFNPMKEGTRTVVTNLRDANYLTASFYKLGHMQPDSSFPWNMTDDNTFIKGRIGTKAIGRAPTLLAEATRATIAAATKANQPFFLVINSADSHRPFPGDRTMAGLADREMIENPSRIYRPNEVTLPAPLPDLPEARVDVARYAYAVRRLDDTVGRCLNVLEKMNVVNHTIALFVSDNGMPMPFGKFETYRDSIRGPLIIRWPGRLAPAMDDTSLVSLTDVAPTMLDMADAPPLPDDIDGKSLLPLIRNKNLVWRDVVVGTRYDDIYYGHLITRSRETAEGAARVNAGGSHNRGTMKRTMNKRGITDGVYHYIYNHFYEPKNNRTRAIPYDNGMILAAMEVAVAGGDLALFDRLDFYLYRAQEEFYNTRIDPGSEKNLIGEESLRPQIVKLQQALLDWMIRTNDPVVRDFTAFLEK
jgi:N-sulfoglucosamine sulfohydrolase